MNREINGAKILASTNDWLKVTNDWLKVINGWPKVTNDWLKVTKSCKLLLNKIKLFPFDVNSMTLR